MKIQCDVCNKKEASIFCTADEASLCDECDHRVHHANKLASKHLRLSLLQSSSSKPPMCDICQETRALVFCQEDRAILCRECDISLHTSNEYTQKHNRFLLTGIKLSTKINNINDNDIITINDHGCDTTVPDHYKSIKNQTSIVTTKSKNNVTLISDDGDNKRQQQQQQQYSSVLKNSRSPVELNNGSGGSSSSNISDYLIETLPGWHFDDFILDPSSSTSAAPFGIFNKGDNNYSGYEEVNEDMASFFDMEEHEKNFTIYSNQSNNNVCVPQAPQAAAISPCVFDTPQYNYGTKKQDLYAKTPKFYGHFRTDDVFTVPQITPSLASNKRARPLW